jgi:hypothetical protein
MNDKKGFSVGDYLDTEILTSMGFIILFGFAVTATILGYIFSKKMGMASLPIWQFLVIIVGEFFGAYFFASRG